MSETVRKDVIGDASADLYAKTLEMAGRDPNSDGLLVILTPQAMTDPTATAIAVGNVAAHAHKPEGSGNPSLSSGQQRSGDDVWK